MKDLVEYIVKQIVTNPSAVVVEEIVDGSMVTLRLTVDPADMGIVIGKGGQTIKSIRKILIIKAVGEGVKVNLELVEPAGSSRPEKADESDESDTKESEELQESKVEETAEESKETGEETEEKEADSENEIATDPADPRNDAEPLVESHNDDTKAGDESTDSAGDADSAEKEKDN